MYHDNMYTNNVIDDDCYYNAHMLIDNIRYH